MSKRIKEVKKIDVVGVKVTQKKYEDGSMRYEAVMKVNGRTKRVNGFSKEEIEKNILSLKFNKPRNGDASAAYIMNKLDIPEVYDVYLRDYKEQYPERYETIAEKMKLKNHINFFYGTKLSNITKQDIVNWQHYLRNEYNHKQSTIEKYLQVFHTFLNSCYKKGWMIHKFNYGDITVEFERKKKTNYYDDSMFYTLDEYKLFEGYVTDKVMRVFYRTMVCAGLRLGECCGLKEKDIESVVCDDGTIKYQLHIQRQARYVRNEGYIYDLLPKDREERYIDISEELVQDLKSIYSLGIGTDGRIFYDKMYSKASEYHKKIKRKINGLINNNQTELDKVITIHQFRHTYTYISLNDFNIKAIDVANSLGHSNTKQLTKTYGHILNKDRHGALITIS